MLVLQWFQDCRRNACLLALVLEHSICLIYMSFMGMLSMAILDDFYRLEIAEIKDAPNPEVGTLLLQQQVPGLETCSFMQPDCPGFGTCSFVQSSVPGSEYATALQPEAVSMLLGPPDCSRVANMKPQDASKNPSSEASESCTFLAHSGGLA